MPFYLRIGGIDKSPNDENRKAVKDRKAFLPDQKVKKFILLINNDKVGINIIRMVYVLNTA